MAVDFILKTIIVFFCFFRFNFEGWVIFWIRLLLFNVLLDFVVGVEKVCRILGRVVFLLFISAFAEFEPFRNFGYNF